MSELTVIRKGGTDAALNQILSVLKAHRFEGADAAKVLSELQDSMQGSVYQSIGNVDLDDIAAQMRKDIADFDSDCAERDFYAERQRRGVWA